MGVITKVKTESREDWLKLRGKYIGGSDAAAVVGMNPYASPYSLWAEKTGKVPGFAGNLACEVGTYLEEFVAQKFEDETGKKVRRCNMSFLNSDYPFAIANIDREIVGEDAGLEIKTTNILSLKKFKGGEYPASYYCQMVHYLAVTGKKKWYLAVLIGNKEFKWFTLERDQTEIDSLMAAEKEFWEKVKNDTPPMVDGTEATTEAVKAVFQTSNESTVDLSGYNSDILTFLTLNQQIKDLEAIRDEAANKIKVFMGETGYGETGQHKVSWKASSRKTFDVKRFEKENPGIDTTGYYKVSNTRTFRVSEKKMEE